MAGHPLQVTLDATLGPKPHGVFEDPMIFDNESGKLGQAVSHGAYDKRWLALPQAEKYRDKVPDSVARFRRTPPYAAKRRDLVSATRTAYAARAIAGARLSLATVRLHR